MSKRRPKKTPPKQEQYQTVDVARNLPMKDGKSELQQDFFPRLKQDSKKEISSLRFWVEVFALIGLLFYVYETYRTNQLTQKNLKLTEEQVHRGQRAYLTPEQFVLAEPLTANHPVKATYWFKNTGQTPAVEVKTGGIIMILNQDFAPNISASQSPITPGSVTFQGAGQSRGPEEEWLEGNPKRMLREDELQDIIAERKHLFAFLIIDYSDIFGQQASTKSCLEYFPKINKLGACPTQNSLQ
jgi:hypothetical protein